MDYVLERPSMYVKEVPVAGTSFTEGEGLHEVPRIYITSLEKFSCSSHKTIGHDHLIILSYVMYVG
jgi:hypothetical protein